MLSQPPLPGVENPGHSCAPKPLKSRHDPHTLLSHWLGLPTLTPGPLHVRGKGVLGAHWLQLTPRFGQL